MNEDEIEKEENGEEQPGGQPAESEKTAGAADGVSTTTATGAQGAGPEPKEPPEPKDPEEEQLRLAYEQAAAERKAVEKEYAHFIGGPAAGSGDGAKDSELMEEIRNLRSRLDAYEQRAASASSTAQAKPPPKLQFLDKETGQPVYVDNSPYVQPYVEQAIAPVVERLEKLAAEARERNERAEARALAAQIDVWRGRALSQVPEHLRVEVDRRMSGILSDAYRSGFTPRGEQDIQRVAMEARLEAQRYERQIIERHEQQKLDAFRERKRRGQEISPLPSSGRVRGVGKTASAKNDTEAVAQVAAELGMTVEEYRRISSDFS